MKPRSRRTFLREAAAGAAGSVVAAAATAQASSALSQDRVAGANRRVRVALIGCGGQGNSDLRNALRQSLLRRQRVKITLHFLGRDPVRHDAIDPNAVCFAEPAHRGCQAHDRGLGDVISG